MKLFRHLALALLLVTPAVTHAQINLAWNDCITQPSAADNIAYACDGSKNGTPYKLVASFIPPFPLPQFVGVQMYFDVALPPSDPNFINPLSDWWRLGVGECRDGNLTYTLPQSGIGTGTTGACQNPWLPAPHSASGFQYFSNFMGNPNQARLSTVSANDAPIALTAGQQYHAGLITLDTIGDIPNAGDPACPGCCQPMLITLGRLQLFQVAGSPGGDITTLFDPATRNYVWWQQNGGACATPAKRTTWGSIKTTYR
jgi:hypothetical protein